MTEGRPPRREPGSVRQDAPEEMPGHDPVAESPVVEIEADEDFTRRIRVSRPVRVGAGP
ncbi:MAG: hypothetical protein Q8L86_11780 [Vicinamibacterales bacterium]|nr:hypothetical protein [Vicinamibacterales bacterium]